MARAKRTERSEARRRYRASLASEEATTGDPAREPTPTRQNAAAAPPPERRIGIAEAFRTSFRRPDVIGDLRALPTIAVRSKALWLPLLITIGATVLLIATGGTDIVSQFLFAYFIQTPALGGVFLAGFLAPRASYLLGIIVGLVAAICYAIVIQVVFIPTVEAADLPAIRDTALAAFVLSPLLGALFASGAAWYRRFLQLSNPNRGRQQAAAARRPDGRSRATSPTPSKPGR